MSRFAVFYRPARADFIDGPTEFEQQKVSEHFEYLKQALEARQLLHAGRTMTNAPVGVGIFEAESPEAAQAFIDSDPVVASGVFVAEVHPYRVALMQGVEPG
ncbi:MAG: hypothetical protein HYR64_05185 [Fimbriimonas ginsengisoli]|uniref:YCII-related domain-containing protein n=1 Tax=Fimbriimonas ginsengisoli TaxID=1005039 RepID=A0A931LSB5_FIMGI|nr:hypothetical protein [Fimbriimonas ginsengisoli]